VESFERFSQNQRIVEEFTSRWLADISCDLGRLVRVSTLRDVSSGRYHHPLLGQIYSASAIHQALLYCHEELFERVLEAPLQQQEWDLRLYFAGLDVAPSEAATRWLEVEYFRQLVPFGAPAYLRDLFFSNIRVILALVAVETPTVETAA
jgi:hypothetical protein